jgi:hypothetical protein
MGYHRRKIAKGTLGHPSKIREEYEEFVDAVQQNNSVMALIELSDMLGAIEAYAARHNITLYDLMIMMKATQSAFKDGTRKSSDQKWRCRRCNQIVDYVNFRCGCTESPSPWEPIEQ